MSGQPSGDGLRADDLSPGVERAVQGVLQDRGGMLTGFLALAMYLDADGNRCWALLSGEDQPMAQSAGMARIIDRTVTAQLDEMLFDRWQEEEE